MREVIELVNMLESEAASLIIDNLESESQEMFWQLFDELKAAVDEFDMKMEEIKKLGLELKNH